MRVPDEVRDCCAFLYCKTTGGDALAGTGFFVAESIIPNDLKSPPFIYFVTAKHVIDGIRSESVDGNVWIRFNMKGGSTMMVTAPIEKWESHPSDNSVDAALVLVNPPPDTQYKAIPTSMSLTEDKKQSSAIGVGDEVFITGLFHSHYGRKRNLPVIRTGNIAMMPDEPVELEGFGLAEVYLVEVRSIGGLSGSPVFVNLGLIRKIGNKIKYAQTGDAIGNIYYWLGLMHGHWVTDQDHMNHVLDKSYEQQLNVGIGIVVPSEKIMEIINQEKWVKQKEGIRRSFQKKGECP